MTWFCFGFAIELCEFLIYSGQQPLSNTWFANIFSYSIGCLFIFKIISFAVQKFFSLMQFHLLIFAFVACVSGVLSKNNCPDQYRGAFSLFSSLNFMVPCVTFKPLIYLELIVVYDVSQISNFILLLVDIQFSQHHLLKRLSFLHYLFLASLSKLSALS